MESQSCHKAVKSWHLKKQKTNKKKNQQQLNTLINKLTLWLFTFFISEHISTFLAYLLALFAAPYVCYLFDYLVRTVFVFAFAFIY